MTDLHIQVQRDIRRDVLNVLGEPYRSIGTSLRGQIFIMFGQRVIDNRMQVDVDVNLYFGHDVFDLSKFHE